MSTTTSITPASAAAPQDCEPRRSEARRPTSWDGLIRLPSGKERPCVVRNVSKSGAMLCVPSTFPLTKTFLLKIEERGFAFAVTVIWRHEDHVGVKIERIVKLSPARSSEAQAHEPAG